MKNVILLIFIGWSILPIHAQGFSELASKIEAPSVGVTLAHDGDFKFGGLSVTANRLSQLLVDGQPAGLAIEGGHFAVTTTDPASKALAQRNFKTTLKAKQQGVIKRAVIWTFDELATTPGSGEPVSLDWLSNYFKIARTRGPALLMARSKFSPKKGTLFAIFQVDNFGKDRYYVFTRDPLGSKTEELILLEALPANTGIKDLSGDLVGYSLLTQPIERQWLDRFTQPMVSVFTKLYIDNDEGAHTQITTTSKLQVMEDETQFWEPNLRSEIWDNNFKPHPNRVVSVKIGETPLDYFHSHHRLTVQLDRPYKAGELVDVTVITEGDLAEHYGGNTHWTLGTFAWYPQPPLSGELAMFDITLRTATKGILFATGETVDLQQKDGFQILHTRRQYPTQFPVVGAGLWKLNTFERNGYTVRIGSLGIDREKAAARIANNYFTALEYFTNLFGVPSPNKEMTILEQNSWGWAQAPPSVIFVTHEIFDTQNSDYNQWFSEGANERLIHEIAHTWWGLILKMDSGEEQWLTESFASYSAAMFLKEARGREGKAVFRRIVKHWEGSAKMIKDGGCIYLANEMSGYSTVDTTDRIHLLYDKGPLVIHALREELQTKYGLDQGDKFFIIALRAMLVNFKNGWGSTAHLAGILQQITKDDWLPWIEKYVLGEDLPKIKI